MISKKMIDIIERKCVEKGIRLTPKRKRVLMCLIDRRNAISAYEIKRQYEKAYDKGIPAMSVYRILEFLQNNSLVHKLKAENKYIICSRIECDHEHGKQYFIVCQKCQKVNEMTLQRSIIDEIEKSVSNENFRLLSFQFEMNSLCSDCDKKI